ncbi:MAG: Gldg family protein [Phycisphaeraceae bacterium]
MSRPTPPPKPSPAQTPTPTAAKRRWRNALLVGLSVLAAVGVVLILNYVVYWQYRGMSPDARAWVRYDLTSTRRYSLSPQTRGVIDDLETQYRVVTMLGGDGTTDEQQQRIRDLVDEYARASSDIDATHIDLDTEPRRRDALLAEMDAMFAEDTESIRGSIADGLEQLERYDKLVDQIEAGLSQIVDSDLEMRPQSLQKQRLTDLHSQYLRLQDQADQIRTLRREMLGEAWQTRLQAPGEIDAASGNAGQSLPDYARLMNEIKRYVIQFVGQTLPDTPGKANDLFNGIVINQLVKAERIEQAQFARDFFASLAQQAPQLLKNLRVEANDLLLVTPPHRYDEARFVLNDKPCVLLTSGGDARVVPADLLFRGAGGTAQGSTNDLFVGEEQLTGALISMKLDPPPLIVFVRSNTGQRALSATGSEGQRLEGVYDHVAKRLLSMDFELVEWANPLREDPPEPRPGQRVVWVTMPFLPPNTARRESLDNARKDKVAGFLSERLAEGDGAMVMLSYNPDTDPNLKTEQTADSLVTLLKGFGIDPQLYHSATRLSEEAEDPSKSKYSTRFVVNAWPDSKIVGRSLDGIDTLFSTPMPLELETVGEAKPRALVALEHPAMYVQRDVPDPETAAFSPEPGSGRERVVIGASSTRGEARLITIGDAYWADDRNTSAAVLPDGNAGPGLAEKPGARILYPGNSDLFVNSVCWLAHEEALIAASPRTQDIRRIDPMTDSARLGYIYLLRAGLPALIFAMGICVWLVRRRA